MLPTMKPRPAARSVSVHPRLLSSLLLAAALLAPRLSTTAGAAALLPSRAMLLEQKVTSSDQTPSNGFGRAVALNGTTALIGAHSAHLGRGAAFIFTEIDGVWTQTQELTGSDSLVGDNFGDAVALSGDTVVVAAPGATINGAEAQGAVYIFHRKHGIWIQSQKLTANDGARQDLFGGAIALSGPTLAVTAEDASPNGQLFQGAAYISPSLTAPGSRPRNSPRATVSPSTISVAP